MGHRLRRWPDIDPTLGQCLVLALKKGLQATPGHWVLYWRTQRVALKEINVDTLVILPRRSRHYRDRLVTLKCEKQGCFLERPT